MFWTGLRKKQRRLYLQHRVGKKRETACLLSSLHDRGGGGGGGEGSDGTVLGKGGTGDLLFLTPGKRRESNSKSKGPLPIIRKGRERSRGTDWHGSGKKTSLFKTGTSHLPRR